jgi:hypothetical protein
MKLRMYAIQSREHDLQKGAGVHVLIFGNDVLA